MKANDFSATMKEMGKTTAQAIQDATDVLVQSHKQGAQVTRQWMELGFDAAEATLRPLRETILSQAKDAGVETSHMDGPLQIWSRGYAMTRDACLGATDAWVRGVEQAAVAVNGAVGRVQPKAGK
jgi:hypothetical protein